MADLSLAVTTTVLSLDDQPCLLVLAEPDAPPVLTVVGQPEPVLEIVEDVTAVLVAPAEQGPAGPPGRDGADASSNLTLTAGATVGAGLIVRALADGTIAPASASDPNDADQAIGMALTAANTGGSVTVATTGPVSEPTWAWLPGPVYLGTAGTLSQTPSPTGFYQQVGVAVAPTQIILGFRPAIILN